jgi:hypothetical protein
VDRPAPGPHPHHPPATTRPNSMTPDTNPE